ncbi:MAG: peptidylprolyl isomerase [Desulfuromonadales bacterium]|nr:peptidylprolyl isomerase [Desulfuromonadales bacterium]MDT8423496.1 peptidylprolyl isomerase [Desulfuromonadales bacterium]
MKLIHVIVASIVFAFFTFPALVCAAPSAGVVAKVGGIPVTMYELDRAVQKIVPLRSSFHSGISADKVKKIRQEALDDLIERAYKVRAALDLEVSVENEAVQSKMAALRNKFSSEKEFSTAFGEEKPGGYRASLYRQLLAEKAEKINVDDKIEIDESAIRNAYESRKHAFFRPQQFRASHILIKIDPASNKEERAALRTRAEELLARARQGEDFYNLAYYNSDDRSKMVGGDIGLFHEGQTVQVFEDAAKKLKVGEISDIVESLYGYHIIKLTEKNPPRQLEYDEVKTSIMMQMKKKLRDQLYAEWMNSLKKKYTAEVFLK